MILIVTKDLIFKTKIRAMPISADLQFAKDLFQATQRINEFNINKVILDLSQASPEFYQQLEQLRLSNSDLKLLAFASHVDQDQINTARGLGIEVLYRSQFVQDLEQILQSS